MPHDPQHSILRKWTGRPSILAKLGEPIVCLVVLNVSRVQQRNKDIYVEQKSRQGKSSRNC